MKAFSSISVQVPSRRGLISRLHFCILELTLFLIWQYDRAIRVAVLPVPQLAQPTFQQAMRFPDE